MNLLSELNLEKINKNKFYIHLKMKYENNLNKTYVSISIHIA